MKSNFICQFEKYTDFVNRDKDELLEIQLEEEIEQYKKHFDDLYDLYKISEPLNYEFIKLSNFYLVNIYNSCIYKTLVNKRSEQETFLLHDTCYHQLPEIIYKNIWESVRSEMLLLIDKTKNLKDISIYSTINGKYESNRYKKRRFKLFDKLRYLYKFFSNYDFSIDNDIYKTLNKMRDLFYRFFLDTTNNKLIDNETKRRFYNELNKYWNNLIETAFEDALLYFILETRLKKVKLNKRFHFF